MVLLILVEYVGVLGLLDLLQTTVLVLLLFLPDLLGVARVLLGVFDRLPVELDLLGRVGVLVFELGGE